MMKGVEKKREKERARVTMWHDSKSEKDEITKARN